MRRLASANVLPGDVLVDMGTDSGVPAMLSGETRFFDGSTLGATYAYSYPVILPIDTREVSKGQVLKVRIGYTICGGMKTLRYSVE